MNAGRVQERLFEALPYLHRIRPIFLKANCELGFSRLKMIWPLSQCVIKITSWLAFGRSPIMMQATSLGACYDCTTNSKKGSIN
jgi:hypothetical protein